MAEICVWADLRDGMKKSTGRSLFAKSLTFLSSVVFSPDLEFLCRSLSIESQILKLETRYESKVAVDPNFARSPSSIFGA